MNISKLLHTAKVLAFSYFDSNTGKIASERETKLIYLHELRHRVQANIGMSFFYGNLIQFLLALGVLGFQFSYPTLLYGFFMLCFLFFVGTEGDAWLYAIRKRGDSIE
jgi:hypothetical protein